MTKSKPKPDSRPVTSRTEALPDGAPDDGFEGVRAEIATAPADAAAELVASKIQEAEALQQAKRLMRNEARVSLARRLTGDEEPRVGVIFSKPWKMYQPDGLTYAFGKSLAERLVRAKMGHYADQPVPEAGPHLPPSQAKAAAAKAAGVAEAVKTDKE